MVGILAGASAIVHATEDSAVLRRRSVVGNLAIAESLATLL